MATSEGLSDQDLQRKVLSSLGLVRNSNENESRLAMQIAEKLVLKNRGLDLVPYLVDRIKYLQENHKDTDEQGNSLADWKAHATQKHYEAARLEKENLRLIKVHSAEVQKFKAENSRLRKDLRMLESLSPKHKVLASYRAKLERWVQTVCLQSDDAWSSSIGLHLYFEKAHPVLKKMGVTTNKFSRLFSELTGLKSVKGGDLKQNMGFRVGVKTLRGRNEFNYVKTNTFDLLKSTNGERRDAVI